MVDGVIGRLDHVVRPVVVEHVILLDSVTTPLLHVMEQYVKGRTIYLTQENAMTSAVQVR